MFDAFCNRINLNKMDECDECKWNIKKRPNFLK